MPARSSRLFARFGAPVLLLVLSATVAAAAPIRFRTIAPSNAGVFSFFFQAVGDVDGDHFPDLIGLQSTNGAVLWLKNTGGALGPAQPISMPFPVSTFATGDLDGDGRADLVVAGTSSANGALAILHSNGSGFDPATLVPTDSAGVVAVTVADLDGDGDLDLVAANRQTRMVHRLFNDGAGHFSGLASTRIPGEVSRTWVADLDGDGKVDILTGNWPHLMIGGSFGGTASTSFTMLGTGGGAFGAPASAQVRGVVALGAFSGIGAHDAYVYSITGIGIARQLGNGTFAAPVTSPGPLLSCGEPFGTPIDLDADGQDEVLAAAGNACLPASYAVLHVDNSLALVRREEYTGLGGIVLIAADMNGDGRQDAVISTPSIAPNVDGRLGGTRLLSKNEPHQPGVTNVWTDVEDVDAADLNHDGTDDVVISTKSYLGAIFFGHHDRTFDPAYAWQGNTYIRQSAIADLNGDGFPDIAEIHRDPGLPTDFYAWINDGTGHAATTTQLHLSSTSIGGPFLLDADGDGDLDVLGGNSPGPVFFSNDGTGHFTTAASSLPATGSGIYGSIPGETYPARFSSTPDTLHVEHGTGVASIGPPVHTLVPGLTAAKFADVNGDGRLDAVCLVSGGLQTFFGQVGGAWSAPVLTPSAPVPAGYTPTLASIGDLDGDHRPDLVVTGAASGQPTVISVLRNLGGGAFGERGDSYPNQPFGTVIADVDGDGAGDLLGIQPADPTGTFTAVNILMGWGSEPQPTPALVSLSSANATFERASLAWFVPSDGPSSLTLERRRESGAWSAIATVTPAAGRITYDDRAVDAGVTYSWRLAWEEDGATQHSDLTTLAIPQRPRFAIAGVRPNPADGDRVSVSLTLDRVAPVELAVVDVAGRVVASRRVTPSSAGRLDVALDGLGSLRPALYFVRAEQSGRRATTTMVRLH